MTNDEPHDCKLKEKGFCECSDDELWKDEKDKDGNWIKVRIKCDHQCTSNCRRECCNCECGEYHNEKNEKHEK